MLIGIDFGQGAVKVTALSLDGAVLANASEEYTTDHPHPGWSEQNPKDWLRATAQACSRLFGQISPTESDFAVEAVGFSAAAHHVVLLDDEDRILRPCIMLTDGRSTDQSRRLKEQYGSLILERTRNQVSPTWSLPQLLWVRENEPEIWSKVSYLTFAKDYIRLMITGTWATDRIEAEGSLFFNAHQGQWDREICQTVPIPMEWCPPVYEPTDVVGHVTSQGESITGIPSGTPMIAGCSDTAAEDFAAGASEPGQAVVKLATAGNVNLMTNDPDIRPELVTYTHPVPGLSYQSMATNSAASSMRWFKNVLTSVQDSLTYEAMDEEAGQAPAGADGILFHPYLLGERSPYWNPDLRASFVGLSAHHDRRHMIRALLEGVALSLADCLEVYNELGYEVSEARIIGGGARSPLWRQIVSDCLGITLEYPRLSDSSAGAALLAGVGIGVYSSVQDALEITTQILATNTPDRTNHNGYSQLLSVYQDVQKRLEPIGKQLSEVSFS